MTHGQDVLTLPGGPRRTDGHSQENQLTFPRGAEEDGLTLPGGPTDIPRTSEEGSTGFPHAAQNGTQLKISELFLKL